MNDKITFPRLATLLADKSGRSKRFSEDFLREFFALISERLEAGESVKVKGLGTFRLSRVEPRRSVDVTTGQPMEISGHSKVVFIPSKELAEAVNAPFEAFTAIEISDDADLSQLFTKEDLELQGNEDNGEETSSDPLENDTFGAEAERTTVHLPPVETLTKPADLNEEDATYEPDDEEDTTEGPDEEEDSVAAYVSSGSEYNDNEDTGEESTDESGDNADEEVSKETTSEEEISEEEVSEDIASEEATSEEEDEFHEIHSGRKPWVRILLFSLGASVVALFATFAIWYVFATNNFNHIFNRTATNTENAPKSGFVVGGGVTTEKDASGNVLSEDTVSTDSGAAIEESDVPTAPSDAIVYDTISTTRYLTTMAKAHYGNFNLWPYIYEENKSFLGHPDRIRPGTPVVIPKLSKYGVDPNNKEDVEKAKKMGVEIYARYGKKI